MNRKILIPIKKPEEIKRPRNALQEAIDRALRPQKTELQKKADEYYDKAFDELCYGVQRLEHLDKGLILFTYSNFSITTIREFKNGSFRIEEFQTTRCPPQGQGRTVGDALNEEWEAEHALIAFAGKYRSPKAIFEVAKSLAFNCN
tara:strand:+ start:414 stop:851 length:438 start_codon:yes stop_codon:yes gene_type:complete